MLFNHEALSLFWLYHDPIQCMCNRTNAGIDTQSAVEETNQDASHTAISSTYNHQMKGYGYNQDSVQRQVVDPSTESIGDPVLVQYGARFRRKYKATPGEEEQLDPREPPPSQFS